MFDWKITKISVEDEVITHAHYVCKLIQDPHKVSTEGNWYFSDKIIKKPLEEIKELDIAEWIEKESMQNGVNTIKLRLEEQMQSLQSDQTVNLPWLPKTFKIKD